MHYIYYLITEMGPLSTQRSHMCNIFPKIYERPTLTTGRGEPKVQKSSTIIYRQHPHRGCDMLILKLGLENGDIMLQSIPPQTQEPEHTSLDALQL